MSVRRKFFGAIAAMFALVSCESEKHSRGLDYIPDMYESPAYKSQQAQVVGPKDNAELIEVHQVPMMLTPPQGTISRDFTPYHIAALDKRTSRDNPNPLAPTASVLKVGQEAYNVYCAVCHGNDGNATKNSYVAGNADRPLFAGIKNLNGANIAMLSDGDIYHIMTYGQAKMPNYSAQLLPQTRWSVVHYVRALNRASVAVEDVDKKLAAAEEDFKANPQDVQKKTDVDALKDLKRQVDRDRELIIKGGVGEDFTPAAEPVPEYIKPQWPEN
jgi:mono/diheme cytochrome c family protein